MSWKDIVVIRVDASYGIDLHLGPIVVVLMIVIALVIYLLRRHWMTKWKAVEVEIPLGGIGKVTIKPNHDITRVAHQAYVELITRKAGLQFERQHDVIVEVYNSWYQLFGEFRQLAKSIPAEELRSSVDARRLVSVLLDSLNKGLRPHLTRWQALFRRWYAQAADAEPGESPQAIQRKFPDYEELVNDLETVNNQMAEFAEALRKIAQGGG